MKTKDETAELEKEAEEFFRSDVGDEEERRGFKEAFVRVLRREEEAS